MSSLVLVVVYYSFFNDPATAEIYTLSLHDALPICRTAAGLDRRLARSARRKYSRGGGERFDFLRALRDRKSTRLNSSHEWISYAVFCLKKKKTTEIESNSKSAGTGVDWKILTGD